MPNADTNLQAPLSKDDVLLARTLLDILAPFAEATTRLQGAYSSSVAAISFLNIRRALETMFGKAALCASMSRYIDSVADDSKADPFTITYKATVEESKEAAMRLFNKYWPDVSDGIFIAHILDPRYALHVLGIVVPELT